VFVSPKRLVTRCSRDQVHNEPRVGPKKQVTLSVFSYVIGLVNSFIKISSASSESKD
jgi:hypothetical protein